MDANEQEHRFLVDEEQALDFFRRAGGRLRLAVFHRRRRVAYTRTTYFDTLQGDYFRASAGPRVRRVRIREYAAAEGLEDEPLLTGLCALEYKETIGTRREKLRFLASPNALARLLETGEPPSGCPPALAELFLRERLVPCVTSWYRRLAFTGDRGVRVTLDRDLCFCRPVAPGIAGQRARPNAVLSQFGRSVLEVKWPVDAPDWLLRAIEPLPPAWTFSKFRAGILALGRADPASAGLQAAQGGEVKEQGEAR